MSANAKAESTQSFLRETATNEAFWVIGADVPAAVDGRTDGNLTNTDRLSACATVLSEICGEISNLFFFLKNN